ncbi:MAG: TonB C-terminal domain-containing protein [Geobacteraceae bacterium]|nr:TonB C-terminal domain-containing protein [Geobacteraceae bacterium]
MTLTVKRREGNVSGMILLSISLHLLTILIINNGNLFHAKLHEAAPYYVDIINLPSISPTAPSTGSEPAPQPAPIVPAAHVAPAPKALPPPPAPAAMALPSKNSPASTAPTQEQLQREQREQDAKNFLERMGNLERGAEAKHQAAALAALQKKASQQTKGGPPAAAGTAPGSDYGAYIQSRLKDALAGNIVYRSQKPEAAVHLYIDKNGKLVRYVMTQPSTDKLFNSSVIKTIENAKNSFPPVPGGLPFDKLFVFGPQEVKH